MILCQHLFQVEHTHDLFHKIILMHFKTKTNGLKNSSKLSQEANVK